MAKGPRLRGDRRGARHHPGGGRPPGHRVCSGAWRATAAAPGSSTSSSGCTRRSSSRPRHGARWRRSCRSSSRSGSPRIPTTAIEPQEVVVTVLFSDIRGFSTIAERLRAREVASVVGQHLSAMAEVVAAHGGTIDKFHGDAVMAVFGAPEPLHDHAERALRCAIAMQERQAELNAAGWEVDRSARDGRGHRREHRQGDRRHGRRRRPARVHGGRRRGERRLAAPERGRRAARSWRRTAPSPPRRASSASRSVRST